MSGIATATVISQTNPDTGAPPAPNAAAETPNSLENEKDPEQVIMEIFDKIVALEAKVDKLLEGNRSQKGGRQTRRNR